MNKLVVFLLLCIIFFDVSANEMTVDQKLKVIIDLYDLKTKQCGALQVQDVNKDQIHVGELLFKSKILSGDTDTSCQTCHLDKFASTDGLPIAVGVGGDGEGKYRMLHSNGILVQRNALSLTGRGLKQFTTYFWDGKVDTGQDKKIISQFGNRLPEQFESPLSVASVLPLLERDEFIGVGSLVAENEIKESVHDYLYNKRYAVVSRSLNKRIRNSNNAKELRQALKNVGYDPKEIELADIGNLLSYFIANKFQCDESSWDKYIGGDNKALNRSEKRGAILFYGKARCASCHSGSVQSDFEFHSIGVPQGKFGPHSRHRDLGRAAITLSDEDLYHFRTPPLIDVKNTAPYGHNGKFKSLRDIVVHHYDPINIFISNKNLYDDNKYSIGPILDSRSKVLSYIKINNESELDDLLSFLSTL